LSLPESSTFTRDAEMLPSLCATPFTSTVVPRPMLPYDPPSNVVALPSRCCRST
jgi:hypothetical protein